MFEPKPHHPKWVLFLYPYLYLLLFDPKMFFLVVTKQKVSWGWHYSWEEKRYLDRKNSFL